MNMAATLAIYAYGTSEGVRKEWDTRGRGRKAPGTVVRGWRGQHKAYKVVNPNVTATEGIGLYVAKTRGFARFFGKAESLYYKTPTNPLVVKEEPLYLLTDEGDPFAPVKDSDSEWTKLNKQAILNAHVTEKDWRVGDVAVELTKLMKAKGYDAVDMTSGGEKWVVLLDPSLYENVKKPE